MFQTKIELPRRDNMIKLILLYKRGNRLAQPFQRKRSTHAKTNKAAQKEFGKQNPSHAEVAYPGGQPERHRSHKERMGGLKM